MIIKKTYDEKRRRLRTKLATVLAQKESLDDDVYEVAHKAVNKMDRRNFLQATGLILLTGLVGWERYQRLMHDEDTKNILYTAEQFLQTTYHITHHVDMDEGKEYSITTDGNGIVFGDYYITMAHIVRRESMRYPIPIPPYVATVELNVTSTEHYFDKDKTSKLEEVLIDMVEDVAVFKLTADQKIQTKDWPYGISHDTSMGSKIYIIGDPRNSGVNIRQGIVSDKDGNPRFKHNGNIFGTDIPAIPNDSGCPYIRADNFKMIGLVKNSFQSVLSYGIKIKPFMDVIDKDMMKGG